MDLCQQYEAQLARHYGESCAQASVVKPGENGRYLIGVAVEGLDGYERCGPPQPHTRTQLERMITILSQRKPSALAAR